MAKKGKPNEPEGAPPPTEPAFVPKAKELEGAWAAFERGDYRGARREAKALLARPDAPEPARQEARELLARTGFDPLALTAVIVVTLVVTGILIALTLGHKFS